MKLETRAVLTEKSPFKVIISDDIEHLFSEGEIIEHTYTVRACVSYKEMIEGLEKTPIFQEDFDTIELYNKVIERRNKIYKEGRHSDYYFIMDNNKNFGRVISKSRFKRI